MQYVETNESNQSKLDALLDGWCEHSPIIPVITIKHPDHAIPMAKALVDGGLNVLEVTLRTELGLAAIEAIRKEIPDAVVGAGTVLTPEQLNQAITAGSQFVVTPGVSGVLLDKIVECQIPVLPGVATISEVLEGYQKGLRRFKFFPAEVAGGVPALKAFGGPLQGVKFCPTGGIKPDNVASYLALDNVMAAGGTWLTPDSLVEQGDWQGITNLARESLALVNR